MVRSIGIDSGDHSVKLVELDGNYRKTRLLSVHTAPVSAAADPAARAEVIAAAAAAAREEGMRGEYCLGYPCREAVLRVIELPFKGRDAIRKVVKAEIEGEIFSHSVDDMVVDFHEIGEGAEGGTRIIVGSVPKDGLRTQLHALGAQGVDPDKVDLDTMALWRVADWAGIFVDDREPNADSEPRVTALVDMGARSVKVLLVDGAKLVEMRALRIGDAVIADEVARQHGLDTATAREVVRACLAGGGDQHVEVPEALPAPATGQDAAPAETEGKMRRVTVTQDEVEASLAAYLQRLARELARQMTASGKASRIHALWVTGGAYRIPGTKEMLAEVMGVEPQEFDVLSHLQHELSPEQAAELGPRLATAIGLALARFGGPRGFDLRQEDLVLARGFERVKFPMAIACMVAWIAMFVYMTKQSKELGTLEMQIGLTWTNREDPKATPLFYGMLHSVFWGKWFEDPQHFRIEQTKGKDYTYKDLLADLVAAPVHKRLLIVQQKLRLVADQKQKESGVYEDVSLESGLAVLVRYSEMLRAIEPQLGRYLVLKIDLSMKAPNRRLEFTVAFREEGFRDRLKVLQQAIDAEYARADSPFEPPKTREESAKEERFRDSDESGVTGAYYKVIMRVKDSFEPFGPSSANALGASAPAPAGGARVVAAEEKR